METEVHKDSESGKSEIVQSDPKRSKLGDHLDAANKKTGSFNHSNQATNGDSDKNNPSSFVNNNLVRDQPPHLSNLKRSAESVDTSIRTTVEDSKSGYNRFCSVKSGDTSTRTTVNDSKSGYNPFRSGDTTIQTTVKDLKSDNSLIDNSHPEKIWDGYNLFASVKSGGYPVGTWHNLPQPDFSRMDNLPMPDLSRLDNPFWRPLTSGDTSFRTSVKDSKSDKIVIDNNSYPEKSVESGPPPFSSVSDISGDKSIKTTPKGSKIDYMTGPIGEDPIMEPTEEDVESDDAIMALYETWCRRNRKSRTPEEMKHRFSFFKENAVRVYKSNIEHRSCRFGLFHWADDPTLKPRPGVTWGTSRDGNCGPYPVFFNDPTLEPRSGIFLQGTGDL